MIRVAIILAFLVFMGLRWATRDFDQATLSIAGIPIRWLVINKYVSLRRGPAMIPMRAIVHHAFARARAGLGPVVLHQHIEIEIDVDGASIERLRLAYMPLPVVPASPRYTGVYLGKISY